MFVWIGSLSILMMLSVGIAQWKHTPHKGVHQPISITPITSSDDWESSTSYDPTGQFIVFQRYIDNCNSNIWLKERTSHKEWQLTANQGVYGKPSWSEDGNSLTFTQRNTCQLSQSSSEFCWAVNTLNLLDAQTTPQKPTTRLSCQNNPTWQAKWLSDGRISFLIENNSLSSIKTYNPKTTAVTSFFNSSHGYTYSYDFSPINKTLAAISLNDINEHVLEVLDFHGNIVSTAVIALPKKFRKAVAFDINYHPSGEYLIISAASEVYKLELDGKTKRLNMGGRTNLSDFSVHPDGSSYIATEVLADADNILLPEKTIKQLNAISDLSPYKLARSNLSEDNPKFQSNGKLIAFTSTRSGNRQIWLLDDSEVKQLSNVQSGLQSKDIAWSPSGDKLAGIFENKVHIWSLNKTQIKVESRLNIEEIFHWYSPKEILVNARVNGHLYLHTLNIESNEAIKLDKKNVQWANYQDNGQLIYLDSQSQFWHESDNKNITILNNQLEQPSVVLYQNKLYGLNKARELWVYSLAENKLDTVLTLPKSARYVSDFNGTDLLITQMSYLKKDLISVKRTTP